MTTKIITFCTLTAIIIVLLTLQNSCKIPEAIAVKTGAQLWGENCLRCHDAPSPTDYGDAQWEVVGMHMKVRANNLTDNEMNKIVAFLQSAN